MEYKLNLEDLIDVKPRLIRNDGGFTSGIIYEIYREELSKLVSLAKTIKKAEKTRNFYDVDLKVIELLQADQNFAVLYLMELRESESGSCFRFTGKKFDENKFLKKENEDVEIVVHDLTHKTNVRFAYAVYMLIDRNWKRYPNSLREGEFEKQEKKKHIDNYFREKLIEYLR